MKLEPAAAATVIGLATFQLWNTWHDVAPSLSDLRGTSHNPADRENVSARQRLYDADIIVGALALTVGVSMAVIAKDLTALIVLITMFGLLALWYHSVLASQPN